MTECKQAQPVLFHVVDRGGARHSVIADRMLTEGREVTFTVAGREVGSFFDPLSAKKSNPDIAPAALCEPVLAVAASFRPRWSGLDWLMFGALVVNAGLMACDLFVRPLF
ncbi:hypothetical protein [Pseudomonas sp. NPDC099000]|uniref:hypothetical protein n=1 Tax=Pseudomonas sp. NPDC099000 TaxID=3364488 RepID=UPI00383BF063